MDHPPAYTETEQNPVQTTEKPDKSGFSEGLVQILAEPNIRISHEIQRNLLGMQTSTEYIISDPQGNILGYMNDESMPMPAFPGNYPFKVHVMDAYKRRVMTFTRSYSVVNSHITVALAPVNGQAKVIGETRQEFSLTSHKYKMFLKANSTHEKNQFKQFGLIEDDYTDFEFRLHNMESRLLANLVCLSGGQFFGRTVSRMYNLSMDCSTLGNGGNVSSEAMTLDQRAILLATVVGIDFDLIAKERKRRGRSHRRPNLLGISMIGGMSGMGGS